MMHLYNESQLLKKALSALVFETGIGLEMIALESQTSRIDVLVKAPNDDKLIEVEVKKEVNPANLGAVIHSMMRLNQPSLLVTNYISPNIGKKLKAENIQFIDTCGNAYINLPTHFVYVMGQKRAKDSFAVEKAKSRAFEASGLKLVYGFLCDEALVNASYREISEKTGVALGAIGKLLTDLQEAGYLLNRNDLKWHGLINRRKLLDRWVEAYPEKLKPKLFIGEFISDNANWWKNIEIEKYDAYWSGEVAAAKYTDYLKPQVTTLYVSEKSGSKLFAAARLRKANNTTENIDGLVKVYRPFWPERHSQNHEYPNYLRKDTVNPILIYADLIASADSRNLEVARMLYDSTIAEYIGED